MGSNPPYSSPLTYPYNSETLAAQLTTYFCGRRSKFYDQVSSTNDLARLGGVSGEPEGSIWVADEQLSGRGRLGRTWSAPAGSSILCTLLLRPRLAPQHIYYLTIAAALAIQSGIKQVTGLTVDIKWPNDIYYHGSKLGGILCEMDLQGEDCQFALIGWGLNVNFRPTEVKELKTISQSVTSLQEIIGQPLNRLDLLVAVLNFLEQRYQQLENGDHKIIYTDWRVNLSTLGQSIRATLNVGMPDKEEIIEGLAKDVAEDGALIIETTTGEIKHLYAGDVTLRR